MAIDRKTFWKRLLIVPPLLLGIAAMVVAVRGREAPVKKPPAEIASKVRVIAVPRVTVVPRVLGFGTVQPDKVWGAVAQVSGKITEIHPQLKKGAILPAGAVLLRIDPTDYRLTVDRIKADIRASQAKLTEMRIRRQNTRASIDIENRSLRITQRELKRKRDLATRGAGSQAAVDQEERALLSMRQSVQNLQNSLNLIPAEESRLQAEVSALKAQLADAELDLTRTTITNPFDSRIADVKVERTQFVNQGQVMATADSIAISEVTAQVSIDKMLQLLSGRDFSSVSIANIADNLNQILGLTPIVRLRTGKYSPEWKGRVVRVSDTIDPQTRTVGVIVAVRNPYQQSADRNRPPLAKNMFVEVELQGQPQKGQIVIPRSALHGNRVYVVKDDMRLEFRNVTTRFNQGRLVLIESGLNAGDRIIVSDLVPAIEGMLLDPIADPATDALIQSEAAGRGAVR